MASTIRGKVSQINGKEIIDIGLRGDIGDLTSLEGKTVIDAINEKASLTYVDGVINEKVEKIYNEKNSENGILDSLAEVQDELDNITTNVQSEISGVLNTVDNRFTELNNNLSAPLAEVQSLRSDVNGLNTNLESLRDMNDLITVKKVIKSNEYDGEFSSDYFESEGFTGLGLVTGDKFILEEKTLGGRATPKKASRAIMRSADNGSNILDFSKLTTESGEPASVGSTYTNYFANVEGLQYSLQNATSNETIQLRSSKNNSGIVVSGNAEEKRVVSLSVVFHSSTQGTNASQASSERYVDVYTKDSAYTVPADLYSDETKGTLVGSLECPGKEESAEPVDVTASIEFESPVTYFGLRSNNGGLNLKSITINLEGSDTPGVLESITISRPEGAEEILYVGSSETLDVSLEPSGAADVTLDWVSSDAGVVTVEGGIVTAVAPGTANVTASATLSPDLTITSNPISYTVEVLPTIYKTTAYLYKVTDSNIEKVGKITDKNICFNDVSKELFALEGFDDVELPEDTTIQVGRYKELSASSKLREELSQSTTNLRSEISESTNELRNYITSEVSSKGHIIQFNRQLEGNNLSLQMETIDPNDYYWVETGTDGSGEMLFIGFDNDNFAASSQPVNVLKYIKLTFADGSTSQLNFANITGFPTIGVNNTSASFVTSGSNGESVEWSFNMETTSTSTSALVKSTADGLQIGSGSSNSVKSFVMKTADLGGKIIKQIVLGISSNNANFSKGYFYSFITEEKQFGSNNSDVYTDKLKVTSKNLTDYSLDSVNVTVENNTNSFTLNESGHTIIAGSDPVEYIDKLLHLEYNSEEEKYHIIAEDPIVNALYLDKSNNKIYRYVINAMLEVSQTEEGLTLGYNENQAYSGKNGSDNYKFLSTLRNSLGDETATRYDDYVRSYPKIESISTLEGLLGKTVSSSVDPGSGTTVTTVSYPINSILDLFPRTLTFTLEVGTWNSADHTYSVDLSGYQLNVQASDIFTVSPKSDTDGVEFVSAGIVRTFNAETNVLTFTATTIPANDIEMLLVYQKALPLETISVSNGSIAG